jgi:hypothetical protein
MTDQPRVFIPKFPVYIPCKQTDAGTEPLGYKDDDRDCVLLFTDKQRCRVFGAQYGYPDYLMKAAPRSLVLYLLERSQCGSDTVWLDPQSGGPTECVIPIAHAIFRLENTLYPEDDSAE